MLVEVNSKGQSHAEHAPETLVSSPCSGTVNPGYRYCLNCGWRPDHVQETGAEIVVHFPRELTELTWPSRGD